MLLYHRERADAGRHQRRSRHPVHRPYLYTHSIRTLTPSTHPPPVLAWPPPASRIRPTRLAPRVTIIHHPDVAPDAHCCRSHTRRAAGAVLYTTPQKRPAPRTDAHPVHDSPRPGPRGRARTPAPAPRGANDLLLPVSRAWPERPTRCSRVDADLGGSCFLQDLPRIEM